jgi:F420-non-reducing hydrogenase large subunit
MALAVTRAARGLLGRGRAITDGALNRLEMAFRLFDPCLSCATHALGQAPLVVRLRAPDGAVLDEVARG